MLPCFFARNLFTLQSPRKPAQHSLALPLLYSPCDWLLTLHSGKPHLLRPDVDLGKSRYHLLSRGVMTCAQTHVSRGRWMEVGAERQNAGDSEGPNQREIAAVQAKLQRCLETYQCVVLPPLCTLVCEECFLDKNRLRLGSSASGLP